MKKNRILAAVDIVLSIVAVAKAVQRFREAAQQKTVDGALKAGLDGTDEKPAAEQK